MDTYLQHHGVLGMKWGVRRYQNSDGSLTPRGEKRYARIDKKIAKIEALRKDNRADRRKADRRADVKKNSKKAAKTKAWNKAKFDETETENKYRIARQQAKKDPAYKKSEEYRRLKRAASKQATDRYLYGDLGNRRANQLMNMGESENYARNRALAESIAISLGTTAALYTINKLRS